jgi:hypothetical protein
MWLTHLEFDATNPFYDLGAGEDDHHDSTGTRGAR